MKTLLVLAAFTLLLACNDEDQNTQMTEEVPQGQRVNNVVNGAPTAADTITAMTNESLMSRMMTSMAGMQSMRSTGDPDKDFAALMKAHHMAAMEIGRMQVGRGIDTQLTAMTRDMMTQHQKEISTLDSFVTAAKDDGGGDTFFRATMNAMASMNINADTTGSMDKQFRDLMIPHHQGGITMAKMYLKSAGKTDNLKPFATKLIRDQQAQIAKLKSIQLR